MAPSMKAKEKHAQALTDALGYNSGNYSKRVMTTRDPASGTRMANNVTRRTSHSSHSSESGRIKTMWKNLISPPAF